MTDLNLLSRGEADQLINDGYNLSISVKDRFPSGRIRNVAIALQGKEYNLSDFQIRRVLASEERNPLPSNLFFLKSSRRDSTKVYIIGGGFGHGRGMCQWGAIGRALSGENYRQILNFYYPALQFKELTRLLGARQ